MSLLSRLFGGGSAPKPDAEPETYEGYRIFPDPLKEPGGFRVRARIEKEIDGEVKSHQLIRADVCTSEDQAREISIAKAQSMIDQMGESLFG